MIKLNLGISSKNLYELISRLMYFSLFVIVITLVLNLSKFDFIPSDTKNDFINITSIILLPLIFLLFACETLFVKNNNRLGEYGNSVSNKYYKFEPISLPDLEVAAVHEIGHVMLFFAVGTPLDRLYVQINDRNIGTSNNGYVHYRYENKGEISLSSKEIQILMLMSLAGTQAERFYYNEPRMFGGSSDFDRWLHYAKSFLIHEENFIFYQSPAHKFEHMHNQVLLSDLKSKHIDILNEFFNINRDVLKEMVNVLIDRKRLDHAELTQYFEKIKNIAALHEL